MLEKCVFLKCKKGKKWPRPYQQPFADSYNCDIVDDIVGFEAFQSWVILFGFEAIQRWVILFGFEAFQCWVILCGLRLFSVWLKCVV